MEKQKNFYLTLTNLNNMKALKLKVWVIVNKDLENKVIQHPNLFSGDLFFTKINALEEFNKRFPKYCDKCSHKLKQREPEIKIIEAELIINSN